MDPVTSTECMLEGATQTLFRKSRFCSHTVVVQSVVCAVVGWRDFLHSKETNTIFASAGFISCTHIEQVCHPRTLNHGFFSQAHTRENEPKKIRHRRIKEKCAKVTGCKYHDLGKTRCQQREPGPKRFHGENLDSFVTFFGSEYSPTNLKKYAVVYNFEHRLTLYSDNTRSEHYALRQDSWRGASVVTRSEKLGGSASSKRNIHATYTQTVAAEYINQILYLYVVQTWVFGARIQNWVALCRMALGNVDF